MKLFYMNGIRIDSTRRFRAAFSPTDLLWQRELAAGFAMQQLGLFSACANYHSWMLYQAVFHWESLFPTPPDSFRCYTQADVIRITQPQTDAPEGRALLRSLWQLSRQAGLDAREQPRLFCLLAAAYFLAETTPEAVPITPQEAEAAYRREESAAPAEDWYQLPAEGEIVLPARDQPYRLRMDMDAARQLLRDGHPIVPRRIVAVPHWEGVATLPVLLELHRSENDPAPLRVTIQPGDYRFCNCVRQIPVYVHPVEVRNGAACLRRRQDSLELALDGQPPRRIPCPGQEIIAFAPESGGEGWMLLTTQGADYRNYSMRAMHDAQLKKQGVVQLAIAGDVWLLLDSSGRMRSNKPGLKGSRLCNLDGITEEGGTSHG